MSLPAKSLVPDAGAIMEQVLIKGDLAKLSEHERVDYYNAVCKSLGLNPLTRPFDYITLNGRLQLYAKRDACDQLRKIQNISLAIVSQDLSDGIYIVHVKAKTPEGREDEDLGAVPLPDAIKGEIRANLILKAITKAKRRATLSICGLGFLDETEVEDIPEAIPGRKTAHVEQKRLRSLAIDASVPKPTPYEELDDEIAELEDTASTAQASAVNTDLTDRMAAASDLKFRLLYSAASEAARRGEAALQAFFKTRTKEEKEELRKIKDELVALYPK
jgi:hypothetical protein